MSPNLVLPLVLRTTDMRHIGLLLLVACSMSGLAGCGTGGESASSNSGSDSIPSGQSSRLAEDQDLIRRSLEQRHQGCELKVTKWHEPTSYYAALKGPVGEAGYSGYSLVDSREAALESVAETNEMLRDLHPPGEELIELELKKLEPIGIEIDVEYDVGTDDGLVRYSDHYLVLDQVYLQNGELQRETREAILQGSSSQSADSTIISGSKNQHVP